MNNIQTLLLNDEYYTLCGTCYRLGNDDISTNSDIEFVVSNNINLTLQEVNLAHLASTSQIAMAKNFLFDSYTDFLKVQPSIGKLEFIFCDISALTNLEDQYAAWCILRNCCNSLFIKVNIYNNVRYLFYSFKYKYEISIVFPVYNVAPYLEQCFAAFGKFPHDFIELLAVNDGATDNSGEVLAKLQKGEPRLKILNKTNGGCASARMYGLEHASGHYVAFIDPDDFVTDDFVFKLHANAVFSQCQVVQCGYNKFYVENNQFEAVDEGYGIESYTLPYYSYLDPNYELFRMQHIPIWRRLYLREFLVANKIEFPVHIRRFDDLPFFFMVFSYCISFISIPDKLYNYRLDRPGQDVAITDKRLFVHFEIFEYLERFCLEKTGRNMQVEQNLLYARVNSHLFAITLLQREFREEYIKKMQADFKLHTDNFLFSVYALRSSFKKYLSLPVLLLIAMKLKSSLLIRYVIRKHKERHK